MYLSNSTVPLNHHHVTVNTLHLQVFMMDNGCKLVTECTGVTIHVVLKRLLYRYSYSTKNLGNRYMHLTNYSINKQNEKYQSNTGNHDCEGHKWYVDSFVHSLSNSLT